MSDGEGSKWSCDYCTYENFPAAKKCTMCFKWKAPHLISDTINEEQDIYKMAPLVSLPTSDLNSSEGSSSSSSCAESNKWACEYCTYLNLAKSSSKCMQCLNPRSKLPQSSLHAECKADRSISGTISVNISESHQSTGGNVTPSRLSPNNSSIICSRRDSNNDLNKANLSPKSSTHAPAKWTCTTCTYENWPRAVKCVLCLNPYVKTSPDSQSHSPVGSTSRSIASLTPPQRRSPTSLLVASTKNNSEAQDNLNQAGASASSGALSPPPPTTTNPSSTPPLARGKRLLMLRAQMRDSDWLWLNACRGAVEGDMEAIHAFIAAGGHPSRQITPQDVELLSRPSAFQVGYTLVHLAIRFQREDMLAILLTATDAAKNATKRLPCMACPDLATDIRRHIVSSIRQRRGVFPCAFLTDCITFFLPTDIEDLPRHIQDQLFDEILDRDVQNELEVEEAIINWSIELTDRLGSRLYALWNRTAGDCLLDSVLQATWGVFDLDNSLRRSLADSLREGAMNFYPRWKEYESRQAESLHFSLDESQWQHDWSVLVSLAGQPGTSLEQTHIFALAHILRRPIIVYGVKYVKSFRGETLGYAKFQGVYLPLLWDSSFCWKNPVALGYTRGHFSALVPMEMDLDDGVGAGANTDCTDEEQLAYLPLVDCEGNLLHVHFLTDSEVGREELFLKEWLDLHKTKGGTLVATQRLGKRPINAKQMVDEWFELYRQLQLQPAPLSIKSNYSSDGEESDDEHGTF